MNRYDIEEKIAQGRERIRDLTRVYKAAVTEESHRIIELQRTLNSLTPAGSLPPELLTKIFAFCAPSPCLELYRVPDPYRWIHATHVCHYWRMIALSSVELWTFVAPRSKRHAEEVLARSKQVLIKVQAQCNSDKHLSCLSLLLDQLPRIQALSLIADYKAHDLTSSPVSAPHLKTITLINSGGTEPLPRFLFKISTASLQHLVLSGWAFSWRSSIFRSTIVKLVVSAGRQRPSVFTAPDVWRHMFEALEAMPKLESLEIKNLLPFPPTPLNRGVILPSLSSLHLSDIVASCAFFIESISFSDNLSVSLDLGTETPMMGSIDLVSLVATKLAWGGSSTSMLRSLSIAVADVPNRLTLRGFPQRIDARELAGAKHDPQLRIIMGQASPDDTAYVLQSLSHDFLASVESCCIRISPPTLPIRDALVTFSEKLPNLTQLAVCGTDSAVILPHMLYHPTYITETWTETDRPPMEFPFPRLLTLALVDVNFSKLKPEDEILTNALRERRDKCFALQKIQLINAWDIGPGEPQKLAQLLGPV